MISMSGNGGPRTWQERGEPEEGSAEDAITRKYCRTIEDCVASNQKRKARSRSSDIEENGCRCREFSSTKSLLCRRLCLQPSAPLLTSKKTPFYVIFCQFAQPEPHSYSINRVSILFSARPFGQVIKDLIEVNLEAS
jgi:hypothetical protein